MYADNNRSASSLANVPRPAFDRMLVDLRARRIDRILVLAQDRLVRRPEQLEALFSLHQQLGISTIETAQSGPQDISTTTGRTNARIKTVFDKQYAEYISEKVGEKKRELAERGLPAGGGTRPFGYEPGGMKVDRSEAKLIKEAARRVLRGDSLHAICRDWSARGIATVTGREWLPNVLRGILCSPRIAGLRAHRGEVLGNAAWPAIIEQTTRRQLQAVFDDPARRRDASNMRLLTGLLRCGRCGAMLMSGSNNGKRAYVCRRAPGRAGCGLVMTAEPVEALVVEAALLRLSNPAVATARTAVGNVSDDTELLTALEADRAALDELTKHRYVSREVGEREYLVASTALRQQIAARERELTPEQPAPGAIARGTHPARVRKLWETLNDEQRRTLLRDAIAAVTLKPAVRGRNKLDLGRLKIDFR